MKLKRVLIANRGEIALRIARTLRERGIESVAVYSLVDRTAPHVLAADFAVGIGAPPPKESYLDIEKVLDAARRTSADAIHPGYGFLSENAAFAQAVTDAGLVFIGPSPQAIRLLGSKLEARKAARSVGVPTVPGTLEPVHTEAEAQEAARLVGYPLLLKAAAGGGGKGIRLVKKPEALDKALSLSRSEAQNAFGSDAVYVERAILEPRHVEIQIICDHLGKAYALGERDCSMQRRHQKIVEETPAPNLSRPLVEEMAACACRLAESVGYRGVGTAEFLVANGGESAEFTSAERGRIAPYFLEMNTRLQVEHPVTELCTGLDLVALQLDVAEERPLALSAPRGHAIEVRIYAEDPARGFFPCPGTIREVRFPSGPFVRVDSGVVSGQEVTRFYDPMLAKLSVWGPDRQSAVARLSRALGETAVRGIGNNVAFLSRLVASDAFARGLYHTGTVAEFQEQEPRTTEYIENTALVAAAIARFEQDRKFQPDYVLLQKSARAPWQDEFR